AAAARGFPRTAGGRGVAFGGYAPQCAGPALRPRDVAATGGLLRPFGIRASRASEWRHATAFDRRASSADAELCRDTHPRIPRWPRVADAGAADRTERGARESLSRDHEDPHGAGVEVVLRVAVDLSDPPARRPELFEPRRGRVRRGRRRAARQAD